MTNKKLDEAGIVLVVIVEKIVYGVSAFNAKCLTCGWVCHTEPHDSEPMAVMHAQHHHCSDEKWTLR